MRTGDTPADERRGFARTPPDILITTPESLFLLLTSAARESLRGVETVIIDEVHAVAATKRGAHLALSLERLDALLGRPAQRVGLSATVRPIDETARFLGGAHDVEIVQPPSTKTIEVTVAGAGRGHDPARRGARRRPGRPGRRPAHAVDLARRRGAGARPDPGAQVHDRVHQLAARGRAALRPDQRAGRRAGDPAERSPAPAPDPRDAGRGHGAGRRHRGRAAGGRPRPPRQRLPRGAQADRGGAQVRAGCPAVVATSSLELGIDMGAVDLVVQIEAPPSVSAGLQRIGRAGHQVGAVSRGVVFPKHRGDLVSCAVVAERMGEGAIEELRYPRNPLDVLAQQIVAMVALDAWQVDELAALVRRAAPFAELPDSALHAVLDMLSGRYPSTAFAELRPRLVWDRTTDELTGRPGAQRLAVTSGGTIPDRGMFGVFLAGSEKASRVGELDEEMVYESRVGDVFLLGSTLVADRGHHPRPGAGLPRAGRPGPDAVLEG